MVSWVELVTKQFNASAAASEWFLGHMADDTWWPMQVCTLCKVTTCAMQILRNVAARKRNKLVSLVGVQES